MPRTPITTSWGTRSKPTTGWGTPRYIASTALSDILDIFLCDISGEQLVTSDPDSVPVNIITTNWT